MQLEGMSMTPTEDDLKQAEAAILEILGSTASSYSPTQLISELQDAGISEYSARVAIWYLIDLNRIELTINRLLRSAQKGSQVALQPQSALAGV